MSATSSSSSRSSTSSIFSPFSSTSISTDSSSILTETSPASTVPKRRYECDAQTSTSKKRKKAMGRPKNEWTSRRQRRLVRLYLMSNLDIEEIAKILEAKDFKPCKRDIQTRLNNLLQPRPDKIRCKGPITQKRLDLLRVCKALPNSRYLQRARQRELAEIETTRDICSILNKRDPNFAPSFSSWDRLDLGSHVDMAFSAEDATPFGPVGLQDEEYIYTSNCLETPLCHDETQCSSAVVQEALQVPVGPKPLISMLDETPICSSWPLAELASDFGLEKQPLSDLHGDKTDSPEREAASSEKGEELCPNDHDKGFGQAFSRQTVTTAFTQSEFSDVRDIEDVISISGHSSQFSILTLKGESVIESTLDLMTREDVPRNRETVKVANLASEEAPQSSTAHTKIQPVLYPEFPQRSVDLESNCLREADSMTTKERNIGSGALSLKSLKRRLSFKYSDSYLGDIISILEHFTISGSSAKSSAASFSGVQWGQSRCSLTSVQTTQTIRHLPVIDEEQSSPKSAVMLEHSLELPGAFPHYCWKDLNQNGLAICDHHRNKSQEKNVLCKPFEHTIFGSVPLGIYSRVVRGIVRPADIMEVDPFGNTILHIAAIFRSRFCHLKSLLEMTLLWKGNINMVNNAGQSFLHLIQVENICDELLSIFDIAKENGFNFCQHDHHGRTALHILTRPWNPQKTLSNIVKKLSSINIIVPSTRDNMGRTIVEQLYDPQAEPPEFDMDREIALLSLSCEYPINAPNDDSRIRLLASDAQCRHYIERLKKGKVIETLEDLLIYERHADLLRTIFYASHTPWLEDSRGRNGLHCLAEFSLDLPHETGDLPTILESTKDAGARERYLESLLAAGVDPNNFDKDGNTPFMAFVIFSRGRNEASITRSLNQLITAKANIHQRNRQGETALHLAVKHGCREATMFLLKHNANIHARDNNGNGVLAIGHEHSIKASHDAELYSQIVLCISLAVGAGAIPSPTIFDEWASPDWRIQRE